MAPLDSDGEKIIRYQDLFIKVKEWGKAFVNSDLNEGNDVNSSKVVPDFVKNLEGQLDRKPSLNSDVCFFLTLLF